MTILGSKTSPSVIYKSESHKLAHSFPVKSGEKALPGQQVVLNTDGTVQGFKTGDSLDKIIGVCILNSETPAYQASKQYGVTEVTVALSGQCIIRGASSAAISAGQVKPTGTLVNSIYPKYAAATPGTDRLTAIALNDTSAADEIVMILVL